MTHYQSAMHELAERPQDADSTLTTWSGQWIGPGAWAGRGVGSGFGAFDGMKIRYEVGNVPGTSEDIVSGFVFTPGKP